MFFGDSQEIILIDHLEKGKTITGDCYAAFERRAQTQMVKIGAQKKKCSFTKTMPSHKSTVAVAKLHEFGFQMIPNPLQSPDLAPCDFLLFPNSGLVGSSSHQMRMPSMRKFIFAAFEKSTMPLEYEKLGNPLDQAYSPQWRLF